MFRLFCRQRRHLRFVASATNSTKRAFISTKPIADIGLEDVGKSVRIRGWITAKRSMKNTIFLDVNDGSGAQNLQVLAAKDANRVDPLGYGVSVDAQGVVGQAPSGQLELKTNTIQVLGKFRNGIDDFIFTLFLQI